MRRSHNTARETGFSCSTAELVKYFIAVTNSALLPLKKPLVYVIACKVFTIFLLVCVFTRARAARFVAFSSAKLQNNKVRRPPNDRFLIEHNASDARRSR